MNVFILSDMEIRKVWEKTDVNTEGRSSVTKKETNGFIELEMGVWSVAQGNQDDSDVVGAAPPHRLAGQLLAGGFIPELLLWKLRLHQPSPLHDSGLLRINKCHVSRRGDDVLVMGLWSHDGVLNTGFLSGQEEDLQDTEDELHGFISREDFKQAVTGQNDEPADSRAPSVISLFPRRPGSLTCRWP